jgi:hypothetical protein
MDKIEKLENRNRFLNNRIAQLNNGKQTEDEQKIIEGDFQEIALNENEIKRLKEADTKL